MRWVRPVWTGVIWLGLPVLLAAQTYNVPLNNLTYYGFEAGLYRKDCEMHTAVKPWRVDELNNHINYDSLRTLNHHRSKFSKTWLGRKLMSRSMLQLDSAKFRIAVDPVFNLEYGRDLTNKTFHVVNTKGARIFGTIGKKVSYYSAVFETQATFMPYFDREVKAINAVPGFGRAKDFLFDNFLWRAMKVQPNGYDFAIVEGYLSYSATKWLNIQLGHDRFFIGDGYRSLFLSDAGFNYPFIKTDLTLKGWKYMMMWNSLQDISIPVPFESGFVKKWGTFHYLSYNATKWFQPAIFGAVVWGRGMANGVGGFNLRFRPINKGIIYAQILIDDLGLKELFDGSGHLSQKVGFQLGAKWHEPFGAKGLMLQAEYNTVRPYTYASSDPFIGYNHYNQPLAHPLGANFHELVGIFHYRWQDVALVYKVNFIVAGRDTGAFSFGSNVMSSTNAAYYGPNSYGNSTAQGLRTTVLFNDLNLTYTINRANNLHLALGLVHRQETSQAASEKNVFVYFSIRTMLSNIYLDR